MVMAKKRIGILTGGGDVPGLNAVIKTVTYRSDPPVNVVSPQPRLSPTVGALLLSQKLGPFAPPALPGINAPTTLSDSRLGISGNLADVHKFRFDRDSLIFCTRLLPAVRAGLLARFLLTGLGWWGARKRGVPLPCVTLAYITSSHAPQRLVTSLRPTTSAPVHVGLPRLRIPQWRSAFFPERSSPFPRR